mmetsp:Transcript_19690/g.56468  ORF Transcript_19690/g.56468 Transcript_19690/m.56468 type:complete len:261 (-) Transcript_19690:181-963(-)
MFVECVVVGHPGEAAVEVRTTQLLGCHHLTSRGFDEWRSAKENGAVALDDDGLVGHGRHIGATGSAGTHHHRYLRDPDCGHVGLVVEDAAEVIPIRKDVSLSGQVGPSRVNQVHARQVVLHGDLLRPQVFLDRDGVVRPALDRRVVGHNHRQPPADGPDARHDAAARHNVLIQIMPSQLRQLQERRPRVHQSVDAVSAEHLLPRRVPLPRRLASAKGDLRDQRPVLLADGRHLSKVGLEDLAGAVDGSDDAGGQEGRGRW